MGETALISLATNDLGEQNRNVVIDELVAYRAEMSAGGLAKAGLPGDPRLELQACAAPEEALNR